MTQAHGEIRSRLSAHPHGQLNGMPGVRLDFDGVAAAMSLVVEDGRITHIYAINNPHKLGRLETVAELTR